MPSKHAVNVAIGLVEREKRWLVALRHPDAHLGGMWEFPGGKQEPRESPEQTVRREVLEECGVTVGISHVLDTVVYEYEDRVVRITPVMCIWESGDAMPLGSAACRWVTREELRALDMPPVTAEILRLAWGDG